MHDLNRNSSKYVVASLGVIASLFMLMVSAYLNSVFMFRLGKTPMDGYVYASAGVAADVLMAICPFLFFASFRNREWVRGFFTLVLWLALTAFSAQSAIGHLASSRGDAASSREVASTTYQDARKDLEGARQELGFVPAHRPTATVIAAIDKHKISPYWIQSNECTQAVGRLRGYCQTYQDLSAELANAMAADRIKKRIEDLQAKAEGIASTHAGVVSDADAGAGTISKLLGWNVRDTQSMLNMLGAMVLLLGAGLGPYVSMATVQNMEHKGRRQPPTAPQTLTVVAEPVYLTTEAGERLDLRPKQPALPQLAAPTREITQDARELLLAIGMPTKPCDKRPKDDRSIAAWRFVAWLAANGHTGDFSAEEVDNFYNAFCMADCREPWATRVIKAEMQQLKPQCAYTSMPRQDNGSRATVWTIKPPSVLRLTDILRRKGIASALPAPSPPPAPEPAEPAQEPPKNVFSLFTPKKAAGA